MSLIVKKLGSQVVSSSRSYPLASSIAGGLNSSICRFYSYYDDDEFDDSPKTALVLGSSGCLGRTVTKHLSKRLGMRVIGVDVVDPPEESFEYLHSFVSVPSWKDSSNLGELTSSLVGGVSQVLGDDEEIDAIICASGGWQGDPPLPSSNTDMGDFIEGAKMYGDTIESMVGMNLYPVLAAGYTANRFMADEGLFVVIGATAALSATPGMLGYGISKVGAHHFVQTLGETTGKAATTPSRRKVARRLRKDSEYLDTLSVVGILPTTIDTPTNREAMPGADFKSWTKPLDIAKEIGTWIQTPPLRPHSGSLVKVHPLKKGGAAFNLAR